MQPNMQPDMRQATEPIEQMLAKIGVQTVFGEAIHEQGSTVIPVAQVTYGFGYGGGYGRTDEEEPKAQGPAAKDKGEGGGSGGGAGGKAKPCGYIRITADGGVTFEPITDETRIPIAGILMAAWAVFWVMLTIRTIAKAVAKTRQMKHKHAVE
jgi:uncharacterized spore protein YtfJ